VKATLLDHIPKLLSDNPISQEYSLGRDTDANYMIACRKD
jgi:2-polyprenyl-3-methyl-5-hydroxy-6-metoxy-1,4-benzoquinol methylase